MSAAALRSWGLDADVPAIELAVSELVAHAVRDGAGPAEMRLSVDGDTIRLEVTDVGRGMDKSREPLQDLGLWFVDEVADDWGVDHNPGRTRVWLVRRRGANPGPSPVKEAGIG
jgi:anti-sigma regulatory factor (Ser/Thr protein kinase)